MKAIALLSQKGGSGKSTLTRALSAVAGEEGGSWILDRDPQQTSAKWHVRRQTLEPAPPYPELIDIGRTRVSEAVAGLRGSGAEGWLFLDTRPSVGPDESEIARAADVILVPVRPSPDDLEAVTDTLAMLDRLGKRGMVIVNAAKNPGRAKDARAALSEFGIKVCPHHVSDRMIFLDAAQHGLAVGEMRGGAAEAADAEVRAVWQWVKEQSNG